MVDKKTIGSAKRPIFYPKINGVGVDERLIEFDWHMGMSFQVRQRSVISLHEAAKKAGFKSVLEASSKSNELIGTKLSAFLLTNDEGIPVENLFQSSKYFYNGKQFSDLLTKTPKEAKTDIRLKESGSLQKFVYNDHDYPLEPKSLFFDWLYISVLFHSACNEKLKNDFLKLKFDAFSDIEFNPKKSFNCQARTLSLIVSLSNNGLIEDFLKEPVDFSTKHNLYTTESSEQLDFNFKSF